MKASFESVNVIKLSSSSNSERVIFAEWVSKLSKGGKIEAVLLPDQPDVPQNLTENPYDVGEPSGHKFLIELK
jgi:hypothetical protein